MCARCTRLRTVYFILPPLFFPISLRVISAFSLISNVNVHYVRVKNHDIFFRSFVPNVDNARGVRHVQI